MRRRAPRTNFYFANPIRSSLAIDAIHNARRVRQYLFHRRIDGETFTDIGKTARDRREHDWLTTSPYILMHWPREFYLTNPVSDRPNRENWQKQGGKDFC